MWLEGGGGEYPEQRLREEHGWKDESSAQCFEDAENKDIIRYLVNGSTWSHHFYHNSSPHRPVPFA